MRRQAFMAALLVSVATSFVSLGLSVPPLSAQAAAAPATTTIIFVRHAEAGAGDPRDPSLTPAGELRAQALLKALSGAGIAAVYASEYQRTQQTGAVVATALNVPTVFPVKMAPPGASASLEDRAKDVIARIQREQPGKTVLVVGHSNTVPMMVKIASGEAVDPIPDTEFDHIFIVTIRDGVAHVIKARY